MVQNESLLYQAQCLHQCRITQKAGTNAILQERRKKKGDIEEWEIVLQLSIFGKAIYLSDAITLTTKKQYQSNISSIRNWFPLLKSDLCWLTTVTVQLTNSLHTNAYMEALLKNEFEWQLKSTT